MDRSRCRRELSERFGSHWYIWVQVQLEWSNPSVPSFQGRTVSTNGPESLSKVSPLVLDHGWLLPETTLDNDIWRGRGWSEDSFMKETMRNALLLRWVDSSSALHLQTGLTCRLPQWLSSDVRWGRSNWACILFQRYLIEAWTQHPHQLDLEDAWRGEARQAVIQRAHNPPKLA